MAENDFDKTVKLPSGAGPSGPVSGDDKTIRITPQDDKTIRLTPADNPAAGAQPPSPKPESPQPAVPPPPPVPQGKSGKAKTAALSFLTLAVLAGAVWYFLPPWLKNRADKLSVEGQPAEAVKLLRYSLYLYPLKCDAYHFSLGQNLRLAKDYSGAQMELEKFLARNAGHFEATRELALTFREAGQTQKAFETWQKCVQMNPSDVDSLKAAAALAVELKDYNAGVSLFETLTKSGRAEAVDWYALAQCYFELGKNAESIAALQELLKRFQKFQGAYWLLAKNHAVQGKYAECVLAAKQEHMLYPDDAAVSEWFAETALQAGKDSLSKKKVKDAVHYFEDGLTVSSRQAPALHYQLAVLYARQRKKGDFLKHAAEAVTADPALKEQARKEAAFQFYRKSQEFQRILK